MRGKVHSFQSMGALDGPGLRFVVFMQGCNLRCDYCHNPDTWDPASGTAYTPEQVLARALRYKPYFGADGGITVSGGEPLLQAKFVCRLFELCHENGIHTCLDTSGQPHGPFTANLLRATDLCLLDIKAADDQSARALCGADLNAPLAFLDMLEEAGIATWIRHVIVPGRNDTPGHMQALGDLLGDYRCIQKVELLPFHSMCLEKYRALNIAFPLEGTPPMGQKRLAALARHLRLPQ